MLIPLGYALFVVIAQRFVGVNYENVGFSARNLLRAVAAPIAVGSALLIIVTTLLRWWPTVLDDDRPLRPWLRLIPAAMALIALVNIDWPALPSLGLAYLTAAAIATLLVGFSEELLARGLVLVGLRESVPERWVWFWSSFIFGAMHILTALAGRALPLSLAQAAAAFVLGTWLYLARRATGSIIPAMLLHALWDFALFTEIGARAQGLPLNLYGLAVGLLGGFVLFCATVVAVVQIMRGRDGAEVPSE